MSCIDCAAGNSTVDTFTDKRHSYRPSSSGLSDVVYGLRAKPRQTPAHNSQTTSFNIKTSNLIQEIICSKVPV